MDIRVGKLLKETINLIKEEDSVIKIAGKQAMQMPADEISQMADKHNVVITEENETTQQQDSLFNIKTWAADMQLDLSDSKSYFQGTNKVVSLSFEDKDNQPIDVYIYEDGTIKISGKIINNYDDFENIVNYHINQ